MRSAWISPFNANVRARIPSAEAVWSAVDGTSLTTSNAAAALGTNARKITQFCESVCFCVSKGLSAPVGSVLCGSQDFIEHARGFRRMVGGNMRQAGPLAAAGIVALDNMVERIPEDHRTAKRGQADP